MVGVAELIRPGSDMVRVAISKDPLGVKPGSIQTIPVYRNQLRTAWENAGRPGWVYWPESDSLWEPLSDIKQAFPIQLDHRRIRHNT
jgi:hypothetical protein